MSDVSTRVRARELVLGTMAMQFTVPATPRIAAAAGAEFILFDMEHTGLSIDRLGVLAASAATDIDVWVRVPSVNYVSMSLPLDVGAKGVMLPSVTTAEEAERAVEAIKYPPDGKRGVAFGLAHDDYRRGNPTDTMHRANESTLLVCQIESEKGVENAVEIASVNGVDVLWVGHNDLTTSLGISAQFDHPRYLEAVEHVSRAASDQDKAGGFRPDSVAHALEVAELGFTCLAFLSDVAAYRSVLSDGLTEIRRALD